MVFNSISFFIFFTIVCLLMLTTNLNFMKHHFGTHLRTIRQTILLISSYIFYAWWDWRFAFLMFALTLIAYICANRYIQTKKKIFTWIAVAVPLIVLGIFKYMNFFIDSFVTVFGISHTETLNIILPVGISFYTFQSLSYSIDVIRKRQSPEKSLLKLSLYIAFFPQLVAGPIVKSQTFLPQLYEDRSISLDNFKTGIQYFVFGFFKKVVIADHLSVCVDAVFHSPHQYHAISILFAVIAYSLQIYCDFSGYSDMAIGCSKCLGYDSERNFNMPYIAKNISVFWKRWHISLSSWLMEYLYIPLGGNRRGKTRTYINLFLTMLIGGLWHGANWTFVVWGALHGIMLCIHKIWMQITHHDKNSKGTFLGNLLSGICTYCFVSFCWIFFRAPDFYTAGKLLSGIFSWQSGIIYISSWTVFGILLVTVFTLIAVIRSLRSHCEPEGYYPTIPLNTVWGLTVLLVIFGLSLCLAYTGNNPFIYFQF